jgi:hypothetical protein
MYIASSHCNETKYRQRDTKLIQVSNQERKCIAKLGLVVVDGLDSDVKGILIIIL